MKSSRSSETVVSVCHITRCSNIHCHQILSCHNVRDEPCLHVGGSLVERALTQIFIHIPHYRQTNEATADLHYTKRQTEW
jgi:hypothetical protein